MNHLTSENIKHDFNTKTAIITERESAKAAMILSLFELGRTGMPSTRPKMIIPQSSPINRFLSLPPQSNECSVMYWIVLQRLFELHPKLSIFEQF
jgi:hypothetical protein